MIGEVRFDIHSLRDQKPAAEGYLFWTEFNPFPHTKPLYEPERVQVEQFICQIKK